jgi:hypothetical protein
MQTSDSSTPMDSLARFLIFPSATESVYVIATLQNNQGSERNSFQSKKQ